MKPVTANTIKTTKIITLQQGTTSAPNYSKTESKSKTPNSLDYTTTHQDIVNDCRRGNRQAQFELYRLYSTAMYNICLRMLKDEMDAEDILQNSFLDVFTKLHTFQQQSSIGAWIKRIVINNCINHLKKRRLYIEELSDKHQHLGDSISDNHIPDSQLSVEKVNRALKQLPDGYRVVFNLYMFEGYDHKEIGQILNISEATSKSQYSRAKRKLKQIICDHL